MGKQIPGIADSLIDEAAKEIERLRSELAFHRRVLANINAVHAFQEEMPPLPIPPFIDEAREAEIERLRSLVQFQDRVIRSGGVACLTSDEREAIEVAAAAYADDHGERFAVTLRSILERLK